MQGLHAFALAQPPFQPGLHGLIDPEFVFDTLARDLSKTGTE